MVTLKDKLEAMDGHQQSIIESIKGWIDCIETQDRDFEAREDSINTLFDELKDYFGED